MSSPSGAKMKELAKYVMSNVNPIKFLLKLLLIFYFFFKKFLEFPKFLKFPDSSLKVPEIPQITKTPYSAYMPVERQSTRP